MKNRIYAIKTTKGDWVYWWDDCWMRCNPSDMAFQVLNCKEHEELTTSYREANEWKITASKELGVPCRVVKINLVEA